MKVRALVICDDQWHPAAMVRQGLQPLVANGWEFEFLPDGDRWSPAMLAEFPVVVVAKANQITAGNARPWLTTATQDSVRNFVRAGGGLLLLHAGTCYRDLAVMRAVTGGAFLSHPEQCAVTVEPKAGHPLTAGVDLFASLDEHYVMALDAPDADVFLQTRSAHGLQPAGWTRTEGAGRVCVLTPGHNAEVWRHPAFQRLLQNTFNWTAQLN